MNDLTKRYHTVRWEKLAKAVMRRDGYQCQLSKRYGRMIPAELVHHVFPADEYPELFWTPWNLVALSRAAHNRVHDRNTNELTEEGAALLRRVARKNNVTVPERYAEDKPTGEGYRLAKSRRG